MGCSFSRIADEAYDKARKEEEEERKRYKEFLKDIPTEQLAFEIKARRIGKEILLEDAEVGDYLKKEGIVWKVIDTLAGKAISRKDKVIPIKGSKMETKRFKIVSNKAERYPLCLDKSQNEEFDPTDTVYDGYY